MAGMSGVLFPSDGEARPPVGDNGRDNLFTTLIVSNPPAKRRLYGLPASIVVHVAVALAVVFLPILWPTALPEQVDYIKLLVYNPPPPPPPRPPLGNVAQTPKKDMPPRSVAPQPELEKPKFTVDIPKETPPDIHPDGGIVDNEMGSPSGSPNGVLGGMEDFGVDGGVLGGVPGGVLGGVVGGTGDGRPVLDPDQPPRMIKQTKPVYPQEAFVKKIEGVVLLEFLIDETGRARPTRVLQSIPALDQAAMECVRQWVFTPAMKRGRPVASIARAPVTFRIL